MADPIDIGDDWEAEPVEHDPFANAGGNPTPPQGLGAIAAQPDPATPSSAGQAPMDPQDRDTMIRTIAGEAGGEGPQGQAAIAHTILNRVADGGYGDGIQGVAQAPVKPGSSYHQFSVWNPPGVAESSATTHNLKSSDPQYSSIGDIVDKVHSGLIPDPTNGATHYYAKEHAGRQSAAVGRLARQRQFGEDRQPDLPRKVEGTRPDHSKPSGRRS